MGGLREVHGRERVRAKVHLLKFFVFQILMMAISNDRYDENIFFGTFKILMATLGKSPLERELLKTRGSPLA